MFNKDRTAGLAIHFAKEDSDSQEVARLRSKAKRASKRAKKDAELDVIYAESCMKRETIYRKSHNKPPRYSKPKIGRAHV